LFREKYEKERKEKTALHHKFEVTKELLQKTTKEKKQLEGQLTARQPASLELQTLKRELVQVNDKTFQIHWYPSYYFLILTIRKLYTDKMTKIQEMYGRSYLKEKVYLTL
jgi:hypothetical protein